MKVIFSILFLITTILASNLSYGTQTKTKDSTTPVYSIQIFSTKSIKTAKKLLNKLPDKLKNNTYLYKNQSSSYIKGYCYKNTSYKAIKPLVETLKSNGFKDAFIKRFNLDDMKNKFTIYKNKNKIKTKLEQKTTTTPTISKYKLSKIILKANTAYSNGNETEAMIYYEMLLASGYKNNKIKTNLCYLYGKRDAWFNVKAIIDKSLYQHELLYAYAYGAVENNQENFYTNIAPYLMLDRSGLLILLSASYFENNHNIQKAITLYEMAYKKNQSNPYILFAYARSKDIQKKYHEAKIYYTKLIHKQNIPKALINSTKQRLLNMERLK